ncbi:hypothetical protein K491DRAFT_705703 [Lophiostoma macrostomum CBS 122681]|uniref:Transcription factor RfeG n=1 Tax=Lophiostoma macrostomum CBS 122681 TaxID=1314788 RepID=A0A6A6T1Y5_9PLEO|nr:hypothetical protein K491DRAFT_705703 [Lophiostoma macrostomum CBS 122681]
MPKANLYFLPGEGIGRQIITADIARYLGPDALVRPGVGTGEQEGVSGYWVTAYHALTPQMIHDLKQDTQRWEAKHGKDRTSEAEYQGARTFTARQDRGPSEPYETSRSEYSIPGRSEYRTHTYTTTQSTYSSSAYTSAGPRSELYNENYATEYPRPTRARSYRQSSMGTDDPYIPVHTPPSPSAMSSVPK